MAAEPVGRAKALRERADLELQREFRDACAFVQAGGIVTLREWERLTTTRRLELAAAGAKVARERADMVARALGGAT